MVWVGRGRGWDEEQLSAHGPVGGSTLLGPLPHPSLGTSVGGPGRRVLCGLYRGAAAVMSVGYFAVFFFCWVFLFSSFF